MIKRTLSFNNPAYLSMRNRQLVIRMPDNCDDLPPDNEERGGSYPIVKTIPIEDIGIVILDSSQITVTQALLSALLENNCAVVTCDNKHLPTGLLLTLYGNTIQSERYLDQINASIPLKKQLWQQTVQAKIQNQALLLQQRCGIEAANMLVWAKSVRSGDPDNLEGRAAAYYWSVVFDNKCFRRESDDVRNAMLNYGYAILRAIVARALAGAGLNPTIGIHHHNRYDAYCLADDIMEPYRPYVDLLVLEIVSNDVPNEITPSIKRKLLELPVKEVVVNGTRHPLLIAVSHTVTSLRKCFSGESRRLLYPEM